MKKEILIGSCFAAMILFSSIVYVSLNEPLYRDLMKKNGAYDIFSEDVANIEAENIIANLRGASLDSDFFNDNEKTHMGDVKRLLDTAKLLTYSSLIVFAALALLNLQNTAVLEMGFMIGALIVDGVLLLLGIFLATFSSSFTLFHKIFFRNTLWMLDPATDNMILLFPEGFFIGMVIRVIIICLLMANITLLTFWLSKIYKRGLASESKRGA